MTVCVAALCHNRKDAVGVYDCMITVDDIEYESTEDKAERIAPQVLILKAGDNDIQTDVVRYLKEANDFQDGEQEVSVYRVAKAYEKAYFAVRKEKAEQSILSRHGLTFETYHESIDEKLRDELAPALMRFTLPAIETIIVGVDLDGAHVYLFDFDYEIQEYTLKCRDECGYACIGSGRRLAELAFIGHGFSPTQLLTNAFFTAYSAKRRAENSPGVGGERTRIFQIVPDTLGYLWSHKYFQALIQDTYETMMKEIKAAYGKGAKRIHEETINVVNTQKENIEKYIAELKEKRDIEEGNDRPESDKRGISNSTEAG